MNGTTLDAHYPEGLSMRKLAHYNHDLRRITLYVAYIIVGLAVLPFVLSMHWFVAGLFSVSIALAGWGAGKRLSNIHAPTNMWRVGTLPTHTAPRLEHIDAMSGQREPTSLTEPHHGGHAATGPSMWVVEVEHTPDEPDGWERRFYQVFADSMTEAMDTLVEDVGIEKHQVTHLREETERQHTINHIEFHSASEPWIDERDDPVKVYINQQLLDGYSFYSYHEPEDPDQDAHTDVIVHTLSGAWRSPYSRYDSRPLPEILAMHELHELTHWACKHRGDDAPDESGWDNVLYGAIDYVSEDSPDGPWHAEERELRIQQTTPLDSEENAAESA